MQKQKEFNEKGKDFRKQFEHFAGSPDESTVKRAGLQAYKEYKGWNGKEELEQLTKMLGAIKGRMREFSQLQQSTSKDPKEKPN